MTQSPSDAMIDGGRRLLSIRPDDPEVIEVQCSLLMDQYASSAPNGNIEETKVLLDRFMRLQPESAPGHAMFARFFHQQFTRHPDNVELATRALDAYEQFIAKSDPRDAFRSAAIRYATRLRDKIAIAKQSPH
ncbi:MAG TPA: hypothetical protein VGK19_01135 [Capsulimonadaceae bacterium]